MKQFKNLKQFVIDNDEFIDNWKAEIATCSEYRTFAGAIKAPMQYAALPEPYLGDPENNLAVIININPGEAVLDYLIQTVFSTHLTGTYSGYAIPFPYLCGKGCPAGQKWWQSKRLPWIKRMAILSGATEPETTDVYPFALEMCPWHSREWEDMQLTDDVKEYIINRVLEPAVEAVKHSKTRVVLVVGKDVYEKLCDCGCSPVAGLYFHNEPWSVWPQDANGKIVDRTYACLEYKGTYFLCTWYQGGYFAPAELFKGVEEEILKRIP